MATTPQIVAATGCPTGIAHTFMAAKALQRAAEARGLTIKVETHGQVGVEHRLTPDEIAGARAVIVAADKDVELARFAGRPLVEASVASGIRDPDALIDRALAAADRLAPTAPDADTAPGADATSPSSGAAAGREADDDDLFAMPPATPGASGMRRHGREVYTSLMNGVSHMLPFVVGGGILIAVSFLWGIYSADPESDQHSPFAAMLMEVGGVSLGLMVPVLSAFIAHALAQRPGLTVGLVTGMIMSVGGAGFLGGIVSGFLSGYGMRLLARLLRGMPESLAGLKAIFIFPLVGVLVFGSLAYLATVPLAGVSTTLSDVLTGFQDSNPVLLGLIVGVMCAFDMGGPVNKAAYVTGVALLSEGNLAFMAGVSAACIAPPLVTAIAVTLFPRGFEPAERRAGFVNYVLGSTHITEGAIPFAARNPLVVIPILMVASSIAAILTYLWGVLDPAPHGGFLVLPVVTNPLGWVVAILLGSVVGGVLLGGQRLWSARRSAAARPNGALA